jgi:hypothetical protein
VSGASSIVKAEFELRILESIERPLLGNGIFIQCSNRDVWSVAISPSSKTYQSRDCVVPILTAQFRLSSLQTTQFKGQGREPARAVSCKPGPRGLEAAAAETGGGAGGPGGRDRRCWAGARAEYAEAQPNAAPPRLRARQHVLHAAMPCDPRAYRRPFGVHARRDG